MVQFSKKKKKKRQVILSGKKKSPWLTKKKREEHLFDSTKNISQLLFWEKKNNLYRGGSCGLQIPHQMHQNVPGISVFIPLSCTVRIGTIGYNIGTSKSCPNTDLYHYSGFEETWPSVFINRKLEVGSWKLDLVNFVHWFRKRLVNLGTKKAPGTKLAKSNFQLPTSNFLFLKTEGHVFSNPLYKI